MIIYSEKLFLENFAAGIIIIVLTSLLSGEASLLPGPGRGRGARAVRLLIASTFCGAYSFIIFLTIPAILSTMSKLIFSLLIVRIVFFSGCRAMLQKWRRTIRLALTFIAVTFAAGGAAFAIMCAFGSLGISANGSRYIADSSCVATILGLAIISAVLTYIFNGLKHKKALEEISFDVELVVGGSSICVRGLVDTGNNLREPFSAKPVHIASRSTGMLIRKMQIAGGKEPGQLVIPFRSLGNSSGLITGTYVDCMIVKSGDKTRACSRAVIAFYESEIAMRDRDENPVEILLNSRLGREWRTDT